MAATQATMDIVNSLTQNDIPIKLRCASCNKLVLDAYRLPCCDQNICGTCQGSLPETCLVCAHSPIAASDCKPNKSLRLTIKAFLKSEEKKREKEKGINVSVPPTPITPSTPQIAVIDQSSKPASREESIVGERLIEDNSGENGKKEQDTKESQSATDARVSQDMAEVKQDANQTNEEDHSTTVDDSSTLHAQASQDMSASRNNQNQPLNTSQFGYAGNQGGPSGANWAQMNTFNPMMQMQMQHNMSNGNWGFPNMMTMGMNPMDMSQGMFGGFGMQNMAGMNGMMGGGMDFNSGYGWNNAQFNGNSYGGPASGGYSQNNQGHFGQFAQNNFQNHNGPHANNASQRKSSVAAHNQSNQGSSSVNRSIESNVSAHKKDTGKEDIDADSLHKAENGNEAQGASPEPALPKADEESLTNVDTGGQHPENSRVSQDNEIQDESMAVQNVADEHSMQPEESEFRDQANSREQEYTQGNFQHQDDYTMANHQYPQDPNDGSSYHQAPMQPYDAMNNNMNYYNNGYAGDQAYAMPGHGVSFGFHGRGRGRGRGGWRGRGGFNANQYTDHPASMPVGQGVEGAPTGPKAMREGFPNRGNFRGRGGFHAQRDNQQDAQQSAGAVTQSTPSAVAGTPLDDAHENRQRGDAADRSPSRSRSRSRSLSKLRQHERRPRSRSVSSGREMHESDKRYDGHKSSGVKSRSTTHTHHNGEEYADGNDTYSRASSVDDSRRHRSRKNDRDRHRSSRSQRDSSRERQKHRRRSRSPSSDYGQDHRHEKEYSSSKATSESGRRKSRSERHRDYDDDRRYKEERSRRKDRESDRDRHRGKDRDERKRSRKDRSISRDVEHEYKSSRRHRYEKNRDKDSDRRRRRSPRREEEEDKLNSRTTPSRFDDSDDKEVEFKIHGRAKEGRSASTVSANFNPPTGPASSRAPPSGPRALLTKISTMNPPSGPSGPLSARKSQLPTPASSETTPAPTTPAIDPHTLEREARNRERMLKEEQRRSQLGGSSSSARKRSYVDHGEDEKDSIPPTGPRGERDRKKKSRRVSYKYEDEENDEARARRVEKEREASRWH